MHDRATEMSSHDAMRCDSALGSIYWARITSRSSRRWRSGPSSHVGCNCSFCACATVSVLCCRIVVRAIRVLQKAVPLFSHLPQYERETSLSLKLKVGFSSDEIHPAILRLGLQYASGNISGSNARCVAMLTALKQFIVDYSTPPAKVMRDDLLSKLKPLVRFLIDSRPQSMSMGNAIRYVKMKISKSVRTRATGARRTSGRAWTAGTVRGARFPSFDMRIETDVDLPQSSAVCVCLLSV